MSAVVTPGHGAVEKIAGEDPCAVYRCRCGCLHVHIGAFTVRLASETFQELTAVLNAASLALAGVPATRPH